MKKIIPVFVALLAIASCICTSCGESGGSNSGSNSNNDLVLPGKDRLWWFEGFDNNDEVNKFIIELKNTGKKTALLALEFPILKFLIFISILVQLFLDILIIVPQKKKIFSTQYTIIFG
jgi:hypothetical protein